MKITTKDKSLKAALESDRECRKHYGADMCKKVQLRLNALKAAVCLGDFWPPKSGPERCHELKGRRAGEFSVDVKQPYRLIFSPVGEISVDDPADERARWNSIVEVELLTIEDTHG